MGYIHIYCGDGKGKTTAALGLALRMAGRNGSVFIARFLKNEDSGEVKALKEFKGIYVFSCEKEYGFSWQMTSAQREEATAYYTQLLDTACDTALSECQKAEKPILLILDEICAAVNGGFIEESHVLKWLDKCRENMEIVMTGREPSDMMIEKAHYVSNIQKIKHPFDEKISARMGIEY